MVTPAALSTLGIENLGGAVTAQRFLQGLDTKVAVQRIRKLESEHFAAIPVHNGDQIQESPRHEEITDVGGPDLIRPVNCQALQAVGRRRNRLLYPK